VCRDGRADLLDKAAHWLDECAGGAWRLALRKVARLPSVTPEIQNAFIPIWVEHKMLAREVGNRRVLAAALRVLLRGNEGGAPLTLYRGTRSRRRRIHGFSWTTEIAVARKFAVHWAQPAPVEWQMSGIVLKTVAPPEAVLLIREPEDYYDEGEVVVDPFRLGRVEFVERLASPQREILAVWTNDTDRE
jgi:hypothetical protein